jgi:CheY-like chemotaxis protein
MIGHRRRVLVVDDNVDGAEMTAELLRLHGFDVVVADSAHAALALVPTFVPEVALLDIGLPDMDGYELARRIAASAIGCLLIALTGYATATDRVRAVEAGFAGHLIKPVRAAAIVAAIVGEDPAVGPPRHRTADVALVTDDDIEPSDRDGLAIRPVEQQRDRRT